MDCCKKFFDSAATPLPYGTLTIIVLINAVLTINNTMIFSYLPKMLKSFGTPEVDVGYQVGLINAVISISWVFSFFILGYLGDTYGRKRVQLCAMCGAMVTGVTFGFSTSFYWALFSRILFGFFMGMTCLLKSILMLACDHTNRTLAFSIYYSAWTLAMLCGPSIASFLVFPVEQYPNVFDTSSIFQRFKVLPPNLIVTFLWICMIGLATRLPNDGAERKGIVDEEPLLSQFYPDSHSIISEENENIEHLTEAESKWESAKKVLLSKDFIFCTLLSSVVDSIGMFLEDMFPVFAATSLEYNGLALTTKQIGIVYLGAAGVLLPSQYLVIPKVLNTLGGRGALIFASLLVAFAVPLFPLIGGHGETIAMSASVFLLGFNFILININYTSMQILINNSTPSNIMGIVYSIAGTSDLIGRAVGPLIYGPLYSWSLKNIKGVPGNKNALGFPLNDYFVFLFIAVSSLLVVVVTKFILTKDVDNDSNI